MKNNVLAILIAVALIPVAAGSALAKATPHQAQNLSFQTQSFQIADDDEVDEQEPAEDPSDDAEESSESESSEEASEDADDPDDNEDAG